MVNDKKNNIAIWKIDKNSDFLYGKSNEDIIDFIIQTFNKKRKISPVKLKTDSYDSKNIKLFSSVRASKGWSSFLEVLIGNSLSEREKDNIFSNLNKDLILFVYDENDIFSITAGSGYNIIQLYIDERFPFEVAKRMLTGEFKSSEARDLTGLVYSQSKNFRRNYNFSRRESFGKVWKRLTGKIDNKILKDSIYIDFSNGKNQKKNFNADIKSSFTFRKSLTFEEIINVIKEIQTTLLKETTKEQDQLFGFLDTLKEVKFKGEKETLKEALFKKIFDFLKSNDSECDSLDFCHAKDIIPFLYGINYKVNDNIKWDDAPSSTSVLLKLRSQKNNFLDMKNFDNFKNQFDRLYMQFQENEETDPIGDDLWKYFHGEIERNKKKYFLIDGKWYEVVGEFLKRLKEDFCNEVFKNKSIITNEIPFMTWDSTDHEGIFNNKQGKKDKFIFGDEVFYKKTDKGKIELFDLLYITDEKVYIIQAKEGFSASIRDACSQIQMSAEIIENNSISNDDEHFKDYFSEINLKNENKLTFEEFIKIIKYKERIYVLAFGDKRDFTETNFIDEKFPSEIARFEVLGLLNDFRSSARTFNLCHIKKI